MVVWLKGKRLLDWWFGKIESEKDVFDIVIDLDPIYGKGSLDVGSMVDSVVNLVKSYGCRVVDRTEISGSFGERVVYRETEEIKRIANKARDEDLLLLVKDGYDLHIFLVSCPR